MDFIIFGIICISLVALGKYLEIKSYQNPRTPQWLEEECKKPIGRSLSMIQDIRYSVATSKLERLHLSHNREKMPIE